MCRAEFQTNCEKQGRQCATLGLAPNPTSDLSPGSDNDALQQWLRHSNKRASHAANRLGQQQSHVRYRTRSVPQNWNISRNFIRSHRLHSGHAGSAPSIMSSDPLSDPRLTPSSVTAVNIIWDTRWDIWHGRIRAKRTLMWNHSTCHHATVH